MKDCVFVLNRNKQPLDPTTPARARRLLKGGKAIIHKRFPFTIRLKRQVVSNTRKYRLKIDYGSRHTGLAILQDEKVFFMAQLHHRTNIKKLMDDRRMYRKSRRNRKTRYRPSRFLNRKQKEDWLPPTLRSRVEQINTWVQRFQSTIPLKAISYELVKFDTQLMDNPDIQGIEYQQGELMGYEIREYLLEKFNRTCVYCDIQAIRLEVEHITPKSKGGTNRLSNLTLACRNCNEEKGGFLLPEWLGIVSTKKGKRNKTIAKNTPTVQSQIKKPLKDVAILNITRWKILDVLKQTRLPVECGTGGLTKMNRTLQSLPKEHHYDACCIGESTPERLIFLTNTIWQIQARGRGNRRRVILNKYGFPRGFYARQKIFFGFMSGDMVQAIIPKGKYKGTHEGFVACRVTGSFDIKNQAGKRIVQGANYKYFSVLQRFDGYSYERREIDLQHSSLI